MTEYRIHLTELSWRIHCTAPEDKVKLSEFLQKELVKYRASINKNVAVGTITIGNIQPYFRQDVDRQQDYKYAKVSCENKEDYEDLIELKYVNIENNISRLLPNMTKDDIAKYFNNQEHNCFIKGVPAGWDHQDLYNYFSQFGKMYSVKVSKTYKWHGKREDVSASLSSGRYQEWMATEYEITHNKFGYASFMNPADQRQCLEQFESKILPKIQTPVGLKIMKFDVNMKDTVKSNAKLNLFVKNFPKTWNEEELKTLFSKYGTVESVFIQRLETGQSKCNGVVLFKDKQDAAKAKDALNGQKIQGLEEPLYVSELIHKEKRKVALTKALLKQNLYVKNLPPDVIKDEELEKFFSQFGKVKNARVYIYETEEKDPIGNPIYKGKGYGFVCFESQLVALQVAAKPAQELIFQNFPLEVHFYEPKQE